ncbi:MAG: TonB family protein [Idiomarina sp.]|nr:TonB family protein [Idiomarina sp.]
MNLPTLSQTSGWLLAITLGLSVLFLLQRLCHSPLLRVLGPRALYSLWILAPLLVLLATVVQLFPNWMRSETLATPLTMEFVANASATAQHLTSALPLYDVAIVFALSIWSLGFGGMIALWCIDYSRLRRLPTQNRLGLRVVRTPAGESPGIAGFIAPRLMLPQDFSTRYSPQEQHLVLQHEFTHWRRGDTRINFFAWLLLATQWFNPLAWQAYRRFRADQELACDADVLVHRCVQASSTTLSTYANALLKTIPVLGASTDSEARPMLNTTHYTLSSTQFWPFIAPTKGRNSKGTFAMTKERLSTLHNKTSRRTLMLGITTMMTSAFLLLGMVSVNSAPLAFAGTDHTAQAPNADAPPAPDLTPGSPPRPIVIVNPTYPEAAKEQGIEGYVDLSFVIDQEGRVQAINIINAEPAGVFETAVVNAFSRWRYAPRDDYPAQIRIDMKLDRD